MVGGYRRAGVGRARAGRENGTLFVGNEQGVAACHRPRRQSALEIRHRKTDSRAADGDRRARLRRFRLGLPLQARPQNRREKHGARASTTAASRAFPTNQEKTRWDRYGSSVVADGKQLYIASRDKNLYALDIEERSRALARGRRRHHDGDARLAWGPGDLRRLRRQGAARCRHSDGATRWTYDAKLGVAGDVVVAGDRVLVGSRSYDLIALDAATGKELWKHYYWFSWIESPPVVRDGVIYTGSSDATNVYAINLADGSLRWKTAVPGWSWQRTAVTDDLVIAGTAGAGAFPGSRAGSLVALDRATGAIRWLYLDPPIGRDRQGAARNGALVPLR